MFLHQLGYIIAALLALVLVLAGIYIYRLKKEKPNTLEPDSLNEMRLAEISLLRNQAEEAAKVIREDANQLLGKAQQRSKEVEDDTQRLIEKAKQRATEIEEDAERRRKELEKWVDNERTQLREMRASHERREARIHDREDRLEADSEGLRERAERLDNRKAELKAQWKLLEQSREELNTELTRIAGLSAEEARAEVIAAAEHEARLSAATIRREIEDQAKREGQKEAQKIIVGAIQRMASEQTSESVITTVDLPNDEMKGRIIGREGRNIRAFEQVTGVNVMVDDTPESVLLSCFDPVRRETARLTLVDLVTDGRIHPARIEEVYQRNTEKIAERIERAGQDALVEVGISNMHPELISILGSLTFRTSYGQNVLRHSVESAQLAGLMAAELGLDIAICKRCAFLHDVGKALTHEIEGSHAIIGAELARKYGEDPEVVHAIESHHNEIEPHTVEAILTQAADAISGSRPGARRESLEAYVERMERLEEIASNHEGVEKVYAMQSGREVRVMVLPEIVDDIASHALAKEIADEIENGLTYPGQIRITVVRESRAIEMAH